jgi:hypothetical protein
MGRTTRTGAVAPLACDLPTWLSGFTATMSAGQPYREPTKAEAADAVAGLQRMLGDGDATALLGPLGFTATSGLDSASGRPFALAFSESAPRERAWAAMLVDASTPVRMVIGCPHPVADRTTEQLGLALWQRVPGALLLVAGAHRDAGGGLADPRDHPESLFHRIAAALLEAGLPHLQVHGFADASAPDADVVLSPGATTAGVPITRVGDSTAAHGLIVVRTWETPVPHLDGSTNIQGRAAAQAGAVFVHVEISATTRATRREQVVDGLAGADLAGTGWPGPILAQAVPGQLPAAVGAASTTGTSPYAARADHQHAERQATRGDHVHPGVAPDDPRLTDPRAPAPHVHTAADLASGRLDPARLPLADPPVLLSYDAEIALDHPSGRSFAVAATGALAIGMSSAQPADGAMVLLEVFADGVAVPVDFAPPTGTLGKLAPPFVVPAGRLAMFWLRHSARAGRWVVVAAGVER